MPTEPKKRLMQYSPKILEQIEQYASIYVKISDMAIILGIPAEVSKAYHRGKASSRVKLLHHEMQLAYVGSPLALENTRNNLLDMEDDE